MFILCMYIVHAEFLVLFVNFVLLNFYHAIASFHWFSLWLCSQVQYMAYVGIGGAFSVMKTLFAGVVFWFMVKFSLGRRLLSQVHTTIYKVTC